MKNFTLIAIVLLILGSVFTWLFMFSSTSPALIETSEIKIIQPISENKLHKNRLLETKIQISQPKKETSLIAKNKEINDEKKVEKKVLKVDEALQITQNLLRNIYNNQSIAFSSEKALLNYLKETNNEQVYQFIIEKLQTANKGNESDDRLIEYSLTLLAAVDSLIASEIFFDFVAKDNWQGSNAIYTIRKSIEKLNRNGNYTDLAQQTFTKSKDDNPFIGELAETIAYHAKNEQVDYLINYIDGKSKNKSTIVSSAMNKIQTESLVPHITSYLSGGSTINVKNTVLITLANMGQYEAASALISWSSKQPKESADQVKQLFDLALRRSPSTKRAIDKELYTQEFASEELKNLIVNTSKEGL